MKRVPAEWEPQAAVWMAWPHNRETWPGRFDGVPDCFRRIIAAIAQTTPVNVIGHESLRGDADIEHLPRVHWVPIETNDCWIRDYGPTFVFESDSMGQAIDWRFNAWGGKYAPCDSDDRATASIIDRCGWPRVASELCLEGGALEWDGNGRLLTTSSCLLSNSRNPGLSRQDLESQLRRLTGTREIVWVDGGGLAGDDTDGHIDQLARFIDPQTVVVATCDPSDRENYPGLDANLELLRRWGRSVDPAVEVHPLPIPPRRAIDGQRVPESYCNFLRLGPDRMLVPTFRAAEYDRDALELLSKLARRHSPDIEVIGIDCHDLAWGLGAIHCASCHEPQP